EGDAQAGAEDGLRLQGVLELGDGEFVGVEELRIRPEAHRSAGIALADRADDFELGVDFAVLEADVVFLAAALDPALEMLAECVDDGNADAVQATGELVGLVGEFAACMEAGEDELDAA